jgi:hypothetical protein
MDVEPMERLLDRPVAASGERASLSTRWHMRGRRLVLTGVLVGLGTLFGPAGAATAQDDDNESTPELAFVGREKPVLRMVDSDRLATVTVALANSGTEAEHVSFRLLVDGAPAVVACGIDRLGTGARVVSTPCPDGEASPPAETTVAASLVERFDVSFVMSAAAPPDNAALEVQVSDGTGVTPIVTELEFNRSLSDQRTWWPIWRALIAAAVFVVGGALVTGATWKPRGLWTWATTKIHTAAAWSFTDSWATSITTLGGVLGTVLGATGFFQEVLPGVSAGRFTGYSLVFGVIAVLAPIAYIALGSRDTLTDDGKDVEVSVGTHAGLLLAGAATVASAAGQLTALGLLVTMADAPDRFQTLCVAGLVAGILLLLVYAIRSARWLSQIPAPTTTAETTRMSSAPGGRTLRASGAM